jgi:predicted CXXCH cytochrome family protein
VTPRRMLVAAAVLAGVVFGVIGTAAIALAKAPPVIKVDNRKFDHDKHSQVSAAAGKAAACNACHVLDAGGIQKAGREHPRCSQCHTYPKACDVMKTAGPKGAARVCQTCHTPTRAECLPKDLPPRPTAVSFQARFTHGKHLTLGASIEKDCAQCHEPQAPAAAVAQVAKGPAHKLCSGCHNANGAKPAMTECQSCHQTPKAKTVAAADPYRLNGFDHRAHHTTSKQASCTGCHDKLLGAGEAALPRPSMQGCLTRCHDGGKAFSATGTKCTQCHKGRDPALPLKSEAGFSHAAHAGRNVKIADCAQCHSIENDGKLNAPLAKKDHMPCAASGCHQTEYLNRSTKICGICHDAASPWQKTASRAKPPAKPEWFESMDHASHLAKLGTGNNACASCHGDKLAKASAPQGHDACAPCHGTGKGPPMSQCGTCHVQTAPVRATISAWSVKSNFDHPGHAKDPRSGKQTACAECHAQIKAAKDLASIKPPTMAMCEGCHNGKSSFKTTGFQCARCHAKPIAKPAQPSALVDPLRSPGLGSTGPLALVPQGGPSSQGFADPCCARTGDRSIVVRPEVAR